MSAGRIAVLDIGKTHARVLLVDGPGGEILWRSERDSVPVQGRLTQELDVAGIDAWLLQSLASLPERERVDAIVPVAHGAAAVLLDAQSAIVAAPDYEDPVFDSVADAYRKRRDPFSQTLSPFLPVGLNLGRQWFFLQQRAPGLFARARTALLYPQYWAWRLSGVAASEVTSLGCHTDLWQPLSSEPSALVARQGWSSLLPPQHDAGAALGPITAEVRARTGLPATCRVHCGLHDSNASFLCHLDARPGDQPFAVISSGTWTVLLAHGAELRDLDESRDMLANIDARGEPIATARFMGGREFAAIAGDEGLRSLPTLADVRPLLEHAILAIPSFAPGSGPFPAAVGRILAPQPLPPVQRAALASLYLALMCLDRLNALRARGPVLIDGPLVGNALFTSLLAALRPTAPVLIPGQPAGAALAARILCGYRAKAASTAVAAADVDADLLLQYTRLWRSACAALPQPVSPGG